MRWFFLLLLMLNAFYYIWHQQEAPLRAKEVLPLSLYRAERQDIQLLSESDAARNAGLVQNNTEDKCLYLGGFAAQEDARTFEQRLISLDIRARFQAFQPEGESIYWLEIDPGSRRLVDQELLAGLVHDFPKLKNKIMSCSGIATTD
ncbi:hypothetical protein [Pseudomonas sp. DWP3-1-2]|jgi:hypothetical protein|uniref:hypothetical protein n=1 Tax=Pseudomonas sp. DWP3-1-2 TaxID=2804645 RepID=UPI003CF63200